jgi:hypothetical protein
MGLMRKKIKSVLDPETAKAMNAWNSLTPLGRVSLMKEVSSTKKTMGGKYHDYLRYLMEKGDKK